MSHHGVIVLDKPAGLSSSKALTPLREFVGKRVKVGHAGTLDPFATGVVLALLGDATRFSNLAMALPKTYVARVLFGRRTDTLDPDGAVVDECDPGAAAPDGLAAACASLVGDILQQPPAFSALKVEGRRAYKLARAGETPALEPRSVTVYENDIVTVAWPEVELRIRCGSGTYIRSIARDLGDALGLPASLSALRRTDIGPFCADDGCAPDAFDTDAALSPLRIVEAAGLSVVSVDEDEARAFVAGRRIPDHGQVARCAVLWNDLLLGLGEPQESVLCPDVVLSESRRIVESETAP